MALNTRQEVCNMPAVACKQQTTGCRSELGVLSASGLMSPVGPVAVFPRLRDDHMCLCELCAHLLLLSAVGLSVSFPAREAKRGWGTAVTNGSQKVFLWYLQQPKSVWLF